MFCPDECLKEQFRFYNNLPAGINRKPILNLISVYCVVGAERYYPAVRGGVVYAAPLKPLKVHVVPVLEVHGPQKEGLVVELSNRLSCAVPENAEEHLGHIKVPRCLGLISKP